MRFPPNATPLLILLAGHAAWSGFAVDAPDSTAARTNYGIRTLSNPASTTNVKVKDGVVVFSATLASDSSEGYTANVALEVPFCRDRRIVGVKDHLGIEFQYRNSEKITEVFALGLDTAMTIVGGMWDAELTDDSLLRSGTEWKTAFLSLNDFDSDVWFFDDPGAEYWAHYDSVLNMARSIMFKPKTVYQNSGFQNGTACNKCVGPTMTKQTLEIRNIALFDKDSNRVELQSCANAAVHPVAPRANFEASYRDGILAVERLSSSSSVDVVSASGRRATTLRPNETRKRITLERGTWFLVVRAPGKAPLTRSLAIVR